ncbi:hypothetical protein [Thalassobellus sediminis]|uniref:hypothetical protein n=1 Tax=Thalassobellus sediminis TaxID=3367753 RepID=UPI0037A0602D
MKKHLLLLTTLIVVSFFTSCTTEEINQDTNLLGVWESTSLNVNSTETHKLIFGDKNTGLSIQETISISSEIISSATSFNWNVNDDVVTIVEDNITQKTFIINSEGQLVLSSSQDLRLNKVSDDYSKYY